jgi:hypothetical protein
LLEASNRALPPKDEGMQKVRFGLALDGQSGWAPRDAVGESTLGPLAFLTMLETHLGLLRLQVSEAERIVQYRECLARARTGRRFYERSFSHDELGVSETLLGWRDDWYVCGWTGQMPADALDRIRDMAEVERLAAPVVTVCPGQRLADVAAVLAVRRPQIEIVELIDTFDAYPLAWRLVLALLPVKHGTDAVPQGEPGSLLFELQEALISAQGGLRPEKLPWRDDGSIVAVRGESRISAAQWLSRRVVADDRDHAIVAPLAGSMLDAALDAAGRPRLGLTQSSSFRPSQQLLPLAMRLIWAPVDFSALVEFLTHASHPVPALARRRIAERLVDSPGLGGRGWFDMKAAIAVELADRAPAAMTEIEYWIEHERHDPADGAPLTTVILRVARLADFFRLRLADGDDARRVAWHAGFVQASAMQQSLQRLIDQGVERIGPEALDKLLAQATARGTGNPLLHAQAGALACVTRPAALIEPFESVTWWQLAALPRPKVLPLGRDEVDALRAFGVDLPDIGTVLRHDAAASLRPILMARRRLTLMLPRPGEEAHPVWLLVSGLLADIPVQRIEALLTETPDAPLVSAVAHRPLPSRRRWWQLPKDATLTWPAASSFSSLEPLLFNPFLWVLRYPARLRPSALLRPASDFRLFGNLAHGLVERLYREPGSVDWEVDRVGHWFDANLERIVDEQGAVLRMPGHRAELESFRRRFRRSLLSLHAHLRAADTQLIEPERSLQADTAIGPFRGASDLVITTRSGRQAIIDMKWAGLKGYRQRLAQQTHLQLAVYGHLLEQATGTWPAVGYYVLNNAALLISEPALFPGLDGVAHPDDATAQLWRKAMATWHWRKKQLDAGAIEVALDGIDADNDSEPPEGALPMEVLHAGYNPFVHLAGWAGS